ncbi:hypothetical protein MB02_06395 [Croceicoccus estronivorus]|uniref:NlpC/P60 family protein n=1 Tax=Croceicoccus estronivorus TaxID=1172626 RepID=UPI0008378A1D|nr:NlpC/P60 family protein [Croceicoccus estronivorus]OCC24239.1 hypothetical protein MB02_06395 [Croceicoccus estronivorus]
MNDPGFSLAMAAKRLVGTPFRLHGRDPATGLDCLGVVFAALQACGHATPPPFAYALRNRDISPMLDQARAIGLEAADGPMQAGDIVMATTGAAQFHVLIAVTAQRFVHAHAGLRRTVATPAPLPWPTLRHWRLSPDI